MARRRASHVRIVFSYAFDWVFIAVLLALGAYVSRLPPKFSRFSLTDITIQYPHAEHDTVSFLLCGVLAVLVPVFVMAAWSFVIDRVRYRTISVPALLWEFNCAILGLALSLTLALVVTSSLKGIVGRPRPDAIARCLPEPGAQDRPVYGLSDISICSQTDTSVLNDGFRSWPSGHSSTAFSGLFFLSLYFAGKVCLFDNKGEVWKMVLVLLPTLGASAIACSRILDKRHHGTDVLSGTILGIASAWISYRLYFPPLSATEREGRAWSIRHWADSKVSPQPNNNPSAYDDVDEEDEEHEIGLATPTDNVPRRRPVGDGRNSSPVIETYGQSSFYPERYELADLHAFNVDIDRDGFANLPNSSDVNNNHEPERGNNNLEQPRNPFQS
ncbi:phosphatidic acid phosphatase type 2/haloperoxidase [Lipomyces japonicus]|uniref:phosphatidic acid phosphatase type 2/haloperoxidase n=1 Tax=Lipomyces japonicus TaxID=56871 RepID=UPI0034CE84EE